MCARLLTCPLCSQPGFLTLDALRAGLISVATRPLVCPVCNEVLLGIDKLTIHLFSHTINLNADTVEPSKHVNATATNNSSLPVHNVHDMSFQNWSGSKVQSTEAGENQSNNNINSLQTAGPSKNASVTKDKIPILNTEICIQNQNLSRIVYISDQNCDNEKISTLHEPCTNTNVALGNSKSSQEILPDTLKLNPTTQYYNNNNNNNKQTSIPKNHTETENENMQQLEHWIQDQHIEEPSKNVMSMDINKLDKITSETVEICENQQNRGNSVNPAAPNAENKFSNLGAYRNITSACTDASLERVNNEKNKKRDSSDVTVKSPEEGQKDEEILPHLKAFKTLATKEKTERCSICGFHFPDSNILLLHKQLVHMIDENDLNVIPENFLKNYSCHLCSKVFKMRGSLMVHMRVAHIGYNLGPTPKDGQVELILNDNGYNCPTCGKKFKKEQHVIQHLKTHEAKQWECDVCSKMFTTKYFLKKHKRLHSGEMPYKCNICNKTFTFQQSYHKHRLYHKDDKPHTCGTCGRSFKELSTLHNHERIHTGEKPFACETCGKCFRQRVSYLVHRRIHTGVMPYKCTLCAKSFRYKVSQRTHKCPMQQSKNAQQESESENPNVIQVSDAQGAKNELCKTEGMNVLQETQPMLQVINNEENKYILIINTQGQHLLTREADVASAQALDSKEEKIEFDGISSENKELKSMWSSNIPNSPAFKKAPEPPAKVQSANEERSHDANDFFSMVLSPLQNGLSSPTAEMEHLRVSSPVQKEDVLEPYSNYKSSNDSMERNMINAGMEQSFGSNSNGINSLQTINEESLKQLLYGIKGD